MDDFVPEAENLLHPVNINRDEVMDEKQNPEADKKEGEESATTGFINHLISNLVTGEDSDKETNPERVKNEEKGSGLLDHIISNLVSPRSPKAGKDEAFDVKVSENESDSAGEGSTGGFINNIVNNFFHSSEGEVRESREEIVKVDAENRVEKTENGGGGVGIVDNIVSHLPTSLPDDAVPTTDEATILIHIVQD